MLKSLSAIFVALTAVPAFASVELVLLPIRKIENQHTAQGEQVVVTVEYQACKYAYKGLYLEQVASGQGQTRFQVRAMATDRTPGTTCAGAVEPRTDSLTLQAPTNDRYDFVAVQPK